MNIGEEVSAIGRDFLSSGMNVGVPATETASIAYDGTLLPAGTGVDPTKRYLKDLGKDKNHVLVESGQGKFFNGTTQYINTGIIPNQAQGTLVTRFTYASGAVSRTAIGSNSLKAWIDAGGKISAVFGDITLTSTDVLVAGRSYHVSVKHSGLNAYLYVDGVLKASGTATSYTPTNALYLGARNNSGTPDTYFNSVIDETYYYDIALTDAQILSLYQYPEKITTNTAGGIVPDIGNVDNCKLFLPMSESNNTSGGNYVVNTAIARSAELVVNGAFDTDTTWVKSTGWTISGGALVGASPASGNQAYQPLSGVSVGALVMITFTISAYTSGTVRPMFGSLGGASASALGTYSQIAVLTTNTNIGIQSFGTVFVGSVDNISVKGVSAFPIVNFSSACVDSAKQLSYGAQCIAWKRDALGVPLGMSKGLSFDGNKSVKRVDTGYIPLQDTNFAISTIMYSKSGLAVNQNSGAKTFRWNINTTGTQVGLYAGAWKTNVTVTPNTYNHIMLCRSGTTLYQYVNGVLANTYTSLTWTSDITNLLVGDDGFGGVPLNSIAGSLKVWKPSNISKFDATKEWAKAQKVIAKLP